MRDLRLSETRTVVRRLRVACAGRDALSARLRLASLFAAAHVAPSGLPPSAVVLIRRVRDPRPGTLSIGRDSLTLPPEWQRSLLAAVEREIRGAARPARGPVPSDAACVVFADRAELLACLAEDFSASRAVAHWWWRSLLGGQLDARTLLTVWEGAPEYVPGALEHLARKGRAAAFARTLDASAARTLLLRLTSAFSLGGLRAALAPLLDESAVVSRVAGAQPFEAVPDDSSTEARTPWRESVPETDDATLDPLRQSLLGVGLLLGRAPATLRGGGFTRLVGRWARASAQPNAARVASETTEAAKHSSRSTATRATSAELQRVASPAAESSFETTAFETEPSASGRRDSFEPRAAPVRRTEAGAEERATGATEKKIERPAEAAGRVRRESRSKSFSERDGAGGSGAREETRAGARIQDRESGLEEVSGIESVDAGKSPRARAELRESVAEPLRVEAGREAVAERLLEAEIETRFGGLFHLINLGLFLGLYGDFTRPAEPGIALPIWDFVAHIGRELVGARVRRDAVWTLLARLAGRAEGEEPGVSFEPSDDWRAPADWLKPFGGAGVWRWSAARGWLRVRHPAGFFVVDVPLEETTAEGRPETTEGRPETTAEAHLARAVEPYREAFGCLRLRPAPRDFRVRARTARTRWLAHVAAYSRARLKLALGVKPHARTPRRLCERSARVYVTATHVDVVMRLCELPIEVRFAGLDRDPGWVPAAGRYVAFHFE